jgi:transposase
MEALRLALAWAGKLIVTGCARLVNEASGEADYNVCSHAGRTVCLSRQRSGKGRFWAASSMTEDEWAFFSRYVETEGRGRPPSDHRRVLDAIFLVALTGRPWRHLPTEFGSWGSVYQQFRRWTKMGLWDAVLDDVEAAAASGDPHRQILAGRTVAGLRRLREKVVAARTRARRQGATGMRSRASAKRR